MQSEEVSVTSFHFCGIFVPQKRGICHCSSEIKGEAICWGLADAMFDGHRMGAFCSQAILGFSSEKRRGNISSRLLQSYCVSTPCVLHTYSFLVFPKHTSVDLPQLLHKLLLLPCSIHREGSWGFAKLKLLFCQLMPCFWRVDMFLQGLGLQIAKFIPLSVSAECSLTYF